MKVIVDSLAVNYEDSGDGPIVLMLHGWGDSLRSFDPLLLKLSGYRFVRIDLPGFGQSEMPDGTWDVTKYANFVAHFCNKLSITPRFVVGHSFGGRILIRGVSGGIITAEKIAFIASAGVADRVTTNNWIFMAIAKIGKVLLKPFPMSWYLQLRRELYRVTGGDYISTGVLRDTFIKVINEDLSKDASRLKVPVLLIWGEDDLVTPLAEGKKLQRLIPSATLKTFREAGHFVHHQKRDEVAELIQTFFI